MYMLLAYTFYVFQCEVGSKTMLDHFDSLYDIFVLGQALITFV